MTEDDEKAGAILAAKRNALRLSQDELAVRLGKIGYQSTIDRIEKGDFKRMPTLLPRLVRELGFDFKALYPRFGDLMDLKPNASAPMPVPELPNRLIPVYGVAVGGDDGRMKFNGERLDMVGCPPELRNVYDAYAVYVSGESMVPSFKPGQIAWVNPHMHPRPGDDVIVQLHPDDEGDAPEGFIKEYVGRRPGKVVVKQYNPEREIVVDEREVKTIHVVVFASRR